MTIRCCCLILLLTGLVADAQEWSTPVRLRGAITTEGTAKTWPSINATGDTLYYAKIATGGNENICYSYRLADSTWSYPISLGLQINTPERELSPSIGPGDSILYFVAYGRPGGYGSYDIWFSRRGADGQWQTPENAGPNINTAGMEWGVYLSRNGQSLYFSTSGPALLDIKKSAWQGNGWGPATALPGRVNNWEDQQNVTLSADERYLILTYARWAASLVDLWSSEITDSGWSALVRTDELSSPTNDFGASLSPDGLTVFLSSARDQTDPYNYQLYLARRTTPAAKPHSSILPQYNIQVFPNPFNPRTEIRFDLPAAAHVELKVFNTAGQLVATLNDGPRPAGSHTVTWDGSRAASGMYIVQINAGAFTGSRKMMLIK
jgi:hypothetical protein